MGLLMYFALDINVPTFVFIIFAGGGVYVNIELKKMKFKKKEKGFGFSIIEITKEEAKKGKKKRSMGKRDYIIFFGVVVLVIMFLSFLV